MSWRAAPFRSSSPVPPFDRHRSIAGALFQCEIPFRRGCTGSSPPRKLLLDVENLHATGNVAASIRDFLASCPESKRCADCRTRIESRRAIRTGDSRAHRRTQAADLRASRGARRARVDASCRPPRRNRNKLQSRGTACAFSKRFCAVTTISSSPLEVVSESPARAAAARIDETKNASRFTRRSTIAADQGNLAAYTAKFGLRPFSFLRAQATGTAPGISD